MRRGDHPRLRVAAPVVRSVARGDTAHEHHFVGEAFRQIVPVPLQPWAE